MNPATAAPEIPFWLEINGRRRTCWTCSPVALEALVVGYLRTCDYIRDPAEVQSIELVEEPDGCAGARVTVPETGATRVAMEQKLMRAHGCGVLHYVTCDAAALRYHDTAALPGADALRDAFRSLFAQTDAAYPDGGMHAAGVMVGGTLRHVAFDVGRHNAVDRAVGVALEAGTALESAGLILSSRVSGAIALKAARARVGYLASRSIPTSLAQRLVDAVGLPLIARAGRGLAREEGA